MRRGPPTDAQPVTDAAGVVAGYMRLRQPIDGNAYKGGWDTWSAGGKPHFVFATHGEAREALLNFRRRWEPEEWPPPKAPLDIDND